MNHSGMTKKKVFESCELATKNEEEGKDEQLKDYYEESQDEREINRVMNKYEKMKIEDPQLLHEIILSGHELLMLLSKPSTSKEELKQLEEIYKDIEEVDEDFLFWPCHKGLEKALIENKNLEIAHFLLVRKGFKLNNKIVHKDLLHDFFKSLSHLSFYDLQDEAEKYEALMDFMIHYGKLNFNEKDQELRNSPLHYAVCFKQINFILYLLGLSGIHTSLENKYQETPLDFAIESFRRKEDMDINSQIIKILIEFGAEANTLKDFFDP